MATVAENLQTLNEAKSAIKMAIEAKGQDMTNVPFTQYAEKIEGIQGGGDSREALRNLLSVCGCRGMFQNNATITSELLETLLDYGDTSQVTNMSYMFNGCSLLTAVPKLDTHNVTNMYGMFEYSSKLTTVPEFDMRNVANVSGMFSGCKALTECWIRNIKEHLQVGSGSSYGHLLTVESLIHLIYELRRTGYARSLTVGSKNLSKLAGIFVKTIEITNEMRAEDDLVDEKLPFVVCESSDEGAMLITDYVSEKGWQVL